MNTAYSKSRPKYSSTRVTLKDPTSHPSDVRHPTLKPCESHCLLFVCVFVCLVVCGCGAVVQDFVHHSSLGYSAVTTQKNFQRKWPTRFCPTELDALDAVVEFIYTKYNEKHKKDTGLKQLTRRPAFTVFSLVAAGGLLLFVFPENGRYLFATPPLPPVLAGQAARSSNSILRTRLPLPKAASPPKAAMEQAVVRRCHSRPPSAARREAREKRSKEQKRKGGTSQRISGWLDFAEQIYPTQSLGALKLKQPCICRGTHRISKGCQRLLLPCAAKQRGWRPK